MEKLKNKTNLPNDIDQEVVQLCNAINSNFGPYIQTIESCCGHEKRTFKIWIHLEEDGFNILSELLYWFDDCHSGRPGWRCIVYTDCMASHIIFLLEGPTGNQAYNDANHIASLIQENE